MCEAKGCCPSLLLVVWGLDETGVVNMRKLGFTILQVCTTDRAEEEGAWVISVFRYFEFWRIRFLVN